MASGRYRSASEVVHAGLRRMEDQESQLDVLRAALLAGEASGEAAPFDLDAFIADKRT
ncbi:type II toxin-antitoxin system ParD family antitoxin [Clavibacter sp. VKM Ac-2542]|uniref:type II toxin-antitoxin system ParD family antitoxin n=1 Tax=Clavibacter TaxID=1573 RepID=UPI00188D26C5|nr:type II toxin-antitoxin system ParD family antitoxin [Clavibacter sp. VKM Ac-2542]MBF4621887.1 type II toxin-antitoxin system ParD family antitoxin [Clavibacter sp. VKM Ac-2542]